MDKAYATGASGENGWQRLFEGTRLQYLFDKRTEKGYVSVMGDRDDGEYVRLSVDDAIRNHRERDLESAWVDDGGATWTTRDPTEHMPGK